MWTEGWGEWGVGRLDLESAEYCVCSSGDADAVTQTIIPVASRETTGEKLTGYHY